MWTANQVLAMVAVVSLPLLSALLLANADWLWNTARSHCKRRPGAAAAAYSADIASSSDDAEAAPESQCTAAHPCAAATPARLTAVLTVCPLRARCVPAVPPDPNPKLPLAMALALLLAAPALALLSVPSALGGTTTLVGIGAAGLASVGRPLHAALCRRAVWVHASREQLGKALPLPLSSHTFVGFGRGHLDVLERLHNHPSLASAAVVTHPTPHHRRQPLARCAPPAPAASPVR